MPSELSFKRIDIFLSPCVGKNSGELRVAGMFNMRREGQKMMTDVELAKVMQVLKCRVKE